jgi:uncharacterized damage-inducible protein DinB
MTQAQTLIPEFEHEMATTRRLLERVPSDRGEWKPHPKSFSLGHLAQLVARMPGWVASALADERLDLTGYPGYSYETTDTLLKEFDANVRAGRAALDRVSDEQLAAMWSLTRGDLVLFSLPKAEAVRSHLSHLYHHRGQLTVYVRLLDIPVPSIYGPTADEGPAFPPGATQGTAARR